MKVLIVGSGGFIGKNLISHLALKGLDVFGISSSDGEGINPCTGILSEQFSIPIGTDAIIYLAQSPYYRQVPDMASHLLNVNVVSAVTVANMARKANVNRFIYTSTGNVYAPSFNPLSENAPLNKANWYSLSKIQAEEALALFRNDMDIVIARLFGVYGPGQSNKLIPNLLNSVIKETKIRIEKNSVDSQDLEGLKLSVLYIQNLIDILTHLLTIKNPPHYLNISSNEIVSIKQIANIMGSLLNKQVKFEISEKERSFDLIADISCLQAIGNYSFTKIDDGIKKMIDVHKNQFLAE
jgi:nucleoside-diphosphate-sugar epimerase